MPRTNWVGRTPAAGSVHVCPTRMSDEHAGGISPWDVAAEATQSVRRVKQDVFKMVLPTLNSNIPNRRVGIALELFFFFFFFFFF